MDDNKKKALGAALSQIERQFGKGAVMRMGDQELQAIPVISQVHWGWTLPWVSGACPRDELLKSMVPNLPVKRP